MFPYYDQYWSTALSSKRLVDTLPDPLERESGRGPVFHVTVLEIAHDMARAQRVQVPV